MEVRHKKYGKGIVKSIMKDEYGLFGYLVEFNVPPVIYGFTFDPIVCLKNEVEIL